MILTTVKYAGRFDLKEGGTLTFTEDGVRKPPRLLRLRSVRTLSLGQRSKHSIVMVTLRYSRPDGTFPGDDELDKESDFFGLAARLTVTITNQPPTTTDPEDLPIDEEDPAPEEEEDAPEG